MKLVGYLRVSTDDKGQDPERQKAPCLARAARDENEVVAWIVDEGTSGGVSPFQRQKVLEAINEAEERGAEGIIVESVDRWTRGGWKDLGVSMFELETQHGLTLTFADLQGDEFVVELLSGIMATVAKLFRKRLQEQIKTGLANAKAKGWPNGRPGRPPKDPLTPEELADVLAMAEQGLGRRRIAHAISKKRGAFELADPEARWRRSITENWIRLQAEAQRAENPELFARLAAIWPAIERTPQVVSALGGEA